MIEYLSILLAALPFYLLGAFPTGVLVAKIYGIDIQSQGSGNVGATNVARVIGKKAGVTTLLIDVIKGALAVYLASILVPGVSFYALAGLSAVAGHCFSIPGKLRGGKGVATALGTLLAISPIYGLSAVLIFAAVFLSTRIVSLSSLLAAAISPVIAFFTNAPGAHAGSIALIALIIIFRHRENIERLSRGEEKRFTLGNK